jgi:hypothetical protein
MKRFLWVTPIVFVLLSACALADSVRISYGPFDFGDNFAGVQRGPGFAAAVYGGTPLDFFNIRGYEPGSALGGSTYLAISIGFAQIGRNFYELTPTGYGELDLSNFTLPTNGKDLVRVLVQIEYSAPMMIIDTGEDLDLGGGARGFIDFTRGQDGLYYAGSFSQAPEPGTLGLMGSGLIGVVALVRRRLRI